MVKFLNVLFQVFDYLFKAHEFYSGTKEGAKEWKDIFEAWQEAEEQEMNPDTVVLKNAVMQQNSQQYTAQSASAEPASSGRRVVDENKK